MEPVDPDLSNPDTSERSWRDELPGSPIDDAQRLGGPSASAEADGPGGSGPEDDDLGPGPESPGLTLTPIEARMLGVLAEKALATPQNYPLSVNALATGCNQSTNRDPITHYAEAEIADELPRLKERKLLRFVHPTSGRGVTKYRHVLNEYLGVGDAETALLSVLLVRGPQTVAELRSRTERLHRFDSTAEIEQCLGSMTDAAGNRLTERLEREPGHREPRWIQTVCPEQGELRVGSGAPAPESSGAATIADPVTSRPGLQAEVDALRRDLDQLRAEFDAFRAEFG